MKFILTDICDPSYASWGIAFWPQGNMKDGYRELVIQLGRREYTLTLWSGR